MNKRIKIKLLKKQLEREKKRADQNFDVLMTCSEDAERLFHLVKQTFIQDADPNQVCIMVPCREGPLNEVMKILEST